jgi:hypothetical protein
VSQRVANSAIRVRTTTRCLLAERPQRNRPQLNGDLVQPVQDHRHRVWVGAAQRLEHTDCVPGSRIGLYAPI